MRDHRLRKKELYVEAMAPKPSEYNLECNYRSFLFYISSPEDPENSSINLNQTCHDRAHTRSVPEITVETLVGTYC